eukprot:TRINITY_DN31272_c0_g1_i1.p1 TRINITY_DN31272_c0_g1~~TRINITY_DN31272_c0_g1_i1.p1  ORF type:complete len:301 (+),score=18.02 TRINITY_DN31272_c0_g1_i1:30-905(+)
METVIAIVKEIADEGFRDCWDDAQEDPKTSCIPASHYWQRPVEYHVAELVTINAIAVIIGVVGWVLLAREKPKKNTTGLLRLPASVEKSFSLFLFALFVIQVWYKLQRDTGIIDVAGISREVVWLSMPCHIYTLLASYALLRRDTMTATLCVTLSWNTFLGSAFADFSDQRHWTEPYVFIVHHMILNLLPLYFAVAFKIRSFTLGWFLWSTSLMTLWNMAIHTPLSYLSGYNVNYHIHPPIRGAPNRIFGTDVFYKPKIIIILMLLSTTSHFLFSGIGSLIIRRASSTKED